MGAFRGLEDIALRLGLESFKVLDVAIQGANILSDQRIAFSFLHGWQLGSGRKLGYAVRRTCSSGVGPHMKDFTDCMLAGGSELSNQHEQAQAGSQ